MTRTSTTATARLEQLDNIVPDPEQPRKRFPEGPLQELADRIWEQGLHQPITITPCTPTGAASFLLFIGERRWRSFQINRERADRLFQAGEDLPEDHPAHRYLRWTHIPVLDEQPMPPADRLLRQVSENDDRADLTLYERALAYQRALAFSELKAKDFAVRYSIDPTTLSTYKGLVNAKGPTKLALELGLVNDAAAARLFQTLPKDQQEELIRRAEEEETTLSRVVVQRAVDAVEEAQRRIQQANAAPEASSQPPSGETPPPSPHEAQSPQDAQEAQKAQATPAAPPASMGPAITVDTLAWLYNQLERLEATADDESFRLEALEAFQEAVLRDSPYIAIREPIGALPPDSSSTPYPEEILQEA